jgi:tyrosyl-tRNA synthetase
MPSPLHLSTKFSMMNLVEELRWRGMVQDIMPGTEEQLQKETTTGYIGFDPTADSLHIGNLVQIILLMHLQKAGHKPIALLGGATGMVGDPSGKSAERNMLSEEVLQKNLSGVKKQLQKFLDFDPSNPNGAEMVNNYDWFREMHVLDFIRDIGKHITVNYMMSKDSVKKRLEGDSGMSFTEFTYQLIQGYDYYWLYLNKNCRLQMGGSDQWGNIVTGTELIRRKAGGEAFAMTTPLVKKADGGKFGKSEEGNVWLDPERTTPFQFYQFWMNSTDEDAANWIKVFSFLGEEEISEIVRSHGVDPSQRRLQKRLAEEVTKLVHGEEEFQKAFLTTEKLFSKQNASIEDLSVEDLENMEGIVKIDFPKQQLAEGVDIVSFLADTSIFPSKGETRKMIQNGGVSINRKKVDLQTIVSAAELLHGKYLLVQKGKKNYYLVRAV